jgi:hypothetical protein
VPSIVIHEYYIWVMLRVVQAPFRFITRVSTSFPLKIPHNLLAAKTAIGEAK